MTHACTNAMDSQRTEHTELMIHTDSERKDQKAQNRLTDHYLLEEVDERIVGHFPGNISFLPGGKRLE